MPVVYTHFPKSAAEILEEIESLAAEVNRDMPGASLDARMSVAMKRNKGSMHPLYVREALIRTPAAPPNESEEPK